MTFGALYSYPPPPPLRRRVMGTYKKVNRSNYRKVKGHLLEMKEVRVKVKGELLKLRKGQSESEIGTY